MSLSQPAHAESTGFGTKQPISGRVSKTGAALLVPSLEATTTRPLARPHG